MSPCRHVATSSLGPIAFQLSDDLQPRHPWARTGEQRPLDQALVATSSLGPIAFQLSDDLPPRHPWTRTGEQRPLDQALVATSLRR